MGQIAEDINDGTSCELCGSYFVDDAGDLYTHGEPVVCEDCWTGLKEKKGHQKATAKVMVDGEAALDESIGEFKIENSSEPEEPKATFTINYKGKDCIVKQFDGGEAEIFSIETGGLSGDIVCLENDGRWTEIDGRSTKEAADFGSIIKKHLN